MQTEQYEELDTHRDLIEEVTDYRVAMEDAEEEVLGAQDWLEKCKIRYAKAVEDLLKYELTKGIKHDRSRD